MDGDDNDGVALDKNVVLKWSSLCKFVPTRPLGACILPAPTVHKQLLFDCSGELKSGTITGLMGLSGSGKSTLLNTLACREVEAPRTFTGEIYLNGVRLHSRQRKSVRYVPQSDIYWTQLSIREHLTYVAQLRIGTGEGASDSPGDNSIESARLAQVYRAACVTAVMDQLCLSHCADTAILHLSGGEKKRVSVATELLDQCQRNLAPMLPKVLLLDEATSGLDSFSSSVLMQALTELVARTKGNPSRGANASAWDGSMDIDCSAQAWCVAMSIHQPSIPLFYSFDSIIFLSDGHVAYCGAPAALMGHLNRLGYYSAYYNAGNVFNNPAEYMLTLLYCAEAYDFSAAGLVQTVGEGGTGVGQDHSAEQSVGDCDEEEEGGTASGSRKLVMRPREHLMRVWEERECQGGLGCDIESRGRSESVAAGVETPTREQSFGVAGAAGSRHSSRGVMNAGDPGSVGVSRRNSDVASIRGMRLGTMSGHSYQTLPRSTCKYARSLGDQYAILAHRVGRVMRPVYLNWRLFGQTVAISAIAGLCWLEVRHVESKVFDISGLAFFTLSYWFFEAVFHGVTELQIDRLLVCKERAAGSYHISAYFLARMTATLGFKLLYPSLFFLIIYIVTGAGANLSLAASTVKFCSLFAILLLSSITADAIGLLIGCLVTGLDEALSSVTIVAVCMLLFGGFYVQKLPLFISWLSVLSPFRYGYNAWMLIEFTSADVVCEGGLLFAACVPGTASQTSGALTVPADVLFTVLGVSGSLVLNVSCLATYCALSLVLSFLALRFRKVDTLYVF